MKYFLLNLQCSVVDSPGRLITKIFAFAAQEQSSKDTAVTACSAVYIHMLMLQHMLTCMCHYDVVDYFALLKWTFRMLRTVIVIIV